MVLKIDIGVIDPIWTKKGRGTLADMKMEVFTTRAFFRLRPEQVLISTLYDVM